MTVTLVSGIYTYLDNNWATMKCVADTLLLSGNWAFGFVIAIGI